MMNFGLDIFQEAVAMVYIVWKYGVGGTRTGDDINEKRKPNLAPTRNAWTPIRMRRPKILKTESYTKLLYKEYTIRVTLHYTINK